MTTLRSRHGRNAKHQIGQLVGGVKHADRFRALRHVRKPRGIAGERGDLGRKPVGRERILRYNAMAPPACSRTRAFAA